VAIEPFRVGDLAALQLDGNAGATGQNDLDITAPPAIGGPGFHPGREPLLYRPPPQRLLAMRVFQAFRMVPTTRRGHPGRMSKVLATSAFLLAFGNQSDDPRVIRQVRPLVARQAHQGLIAVMTFLPPLQGLSVLGVDFESSCQVQADDKYICHYDTSDDERAAADSELPAPHG
jgi:hypothetical protein